MIVIDASLLVAFIRKEPGWKKLAEYLKLCVTIDLALKEVLNAVWKDVAVRKTMGIDIAAQLMEILFSMVGVNIDVEPEIKYLPKAFEIALKTGVTVYDALYIALAMERKLPLATIDEKQAKAAQALGVETIIPST
ncbi:MAG: type II toxin-antitoxin system VapC family toxin [Ignisphaera sp.]|uniref:type II toxin-antitoxin system VapC family toxin n=1 Tax=Thermofilum sp. TaxID=1961369 RepID=UPI00316054A4